MEKQGEFNNQIKAIFNNGKIHQIKWGEDGDENKGWKSWDIETKLDYAMNLASAMNQAAEILQNERNDMQEVVRVSLANCENAQKAYDIQKEIVTNTITTDNAIKNDLAEQIQKLQYRIKIQDALLYRFEQAEKA